jgi:polyisoprenoid-binding protein YceI
MAHEKWNVDVVHSTVGFTVRHLMVSKVHGYFTKWNASIEFDPERPQDSRISADIEVASVDTREPQRDAHLRSGDFFEVEKFPQMTYRSTSVTAAGADRFKVSGDLTLRGVTKPVVLDVEYAGRSKHPRLGERIGFSAHANINRKDFGITFNQVLDAGGVALGDKIDITIEIEATPA